MKHTRRTLTEEQKVQAWGFKLVALGKPCAACGAYLHKVDAHHAITADYLRRNHPEHVYDKRNCVPLCRSCHDGHTSAMARILRSALPESVEEFAAELGLGWYLDRYYPSEQAA